jgi:predicted nucleic acid-binding protein
VTVAGHLVLVPEIIDYEHRRELLLNDSLAAVARLDAFKENGAYLPVSEAAFLTGAQFWATARRKGQPTADRHALDADMLLAAQAATFDRLDWDRSAEEDVVIATTNVGHLSRFADARLWKDIPTTFLEENG